MRVALVGNNDGPLILANAMLKGEKRPVCIGLQNPVSQILEAGYVGLVGEQNYFSDFNELSLLEKLKQFDFDILINCFCNFRFTKLLERYKVLNVHLAPLPKYRGRHPLHWALVNGEGEFGFTVHKMDADFDAGEIYWQETVLVTPGMSVEELRNTLMKKLATGFKGFLEDYTNGTIRPWPNNDAEATYAPKRNPADSRLTEWDDGAALYRKTMALRSGNYPAYFKADGQKITVSRAELLSGEKEKEIDKKWTLPESEGREATIEKLLENGISVRCHDGRRIRLYGFQPEKYNLKENQKLK